VLYYDFIGRSFQCAGWRYLYAGTLFLVRTVAINVNKNAIPAAIRKKMQL
jgi:hypothetical protein